jgi:hypothetical protein
VGDEDWGRLTEYEEMHWIEMAGLAEFDGVAVWESNVLVSVATVMSVVVYVVYVVNMLVHVEVMSVVGSAAEGYWD